MQSIFKFHSKEKLDAGHETVWIIFKSAGLQMTILGY